MTKDEFAKYLTKNGYPAENDGGVVRITKEKPLTKADVKAVHNMMRETGYSASYGYTLCANGR